MPNTLPEVSESLAAFNEAIVSLNDAVTTGSDLLKVQLNYFGPNTDVVISFLQWGVLQCSFAWQELLNQVSLRAVERFNLTVLSNEETKWLQKIFADPRGTYLDHLYGSRPEFIYLIRAITLMHRLSFPVYQELLGPAFSKGAPLPGFTAATMENYLKRIGGKVIEKPQPKNYRETLSELPHLEVNIRNHKYKLIKLSDLPVRRVFSSMVRQENIRNYAGVMWYDSSAVDTSLLTDFRRSVAPGFWQPVMVDRDLYVDRMYPSDEPRSIHLPDVTYVVLDEDFSLIEWVRPPSSACPQCNREYVVVFFNRITEQSFCTDCSRICYECKKNYSSASFCCTLELHYSHTEGRNYIGCPNQTENYHPIDCQKLHLGVELEYSNFTSPTHRLNVAKAIKTETQGLMDVDFKSDSSLVGLSMEIAYQPHTWPVLETMKFPYLSMVEENNTEGAGLHVHVSKNYLHTQYAQAIFHDIFNDFDIPKYAGRDFTQYCQRTTTFMDNPAYYGRTGGFSTERENRTNKYRAVNFCPRHTIEVRVFRAPTTREELLGRVGMVEAAARFARGNKRFAFDPNRNALEQFLEWAAESSTVSDIVKKYLANPPGVISLNNEEDYQECDHCESYGHSSWDCEQLCSFDWCDSCRENDDPDW